MRDYFSVAVGIFFDSFSLKDFKIDPFRIFFECLNQFEVRETPRFLLKGDCTIPLFFRQVCTAGLALRPESLCFICFRFITGRKHYQQLDLRF